MPKLDETTLKPSLKLVAKGKRWIELSTGEVVADFHAWACPTLRDEVVRRFNEFHERRK